MNRWKAATAHLTISLVLATTIATLLYVLWFPPPYFIAAGASKLIMVLMGVDIGIGPLLTLLVFSPRKSRKLLRLDLSVIAVLQATAFAYGVHAIAMARPAFVVAEIDRLVLVPAGELTDADLAQGSQPAFRTRSWIGPVLVGALPPKGAEGTKITNQILAGGKDIDQLPKFYVPYDQVIDRVMHHAKVLSQLKNATDNQRKQLEQFQVGADDEVLLALPLQRGEQDYTAIMSPKSRHPIRILSIDPW
jgi:hypothetical protein